MPWNTKSDVRCSAKQPVACSTLVVLACFALASCGGGPGAVHPDLMVEDPEVSDHRPAAGASFTFSASVRNAGRGSAAATMLRVYRSDDETITPADEQVAAGTVAALAASASGVASVNLTAPSSPGIHYYRACVDPVAGESDTANNCSATVEVIVQVQDTEPALPRPDLVVEFPGVSEDRPAAGASFKFSAMVRNAGDGPAAETTLSVYRSDDATVTTSDQEVETATVPELATLKSMFASVELSAPSSSGTYYYGACVHAVAGESDTANNCSAPAQVTVQAPQVKSAPPPDLFVDGPRVKHATGAAGGVFELWAEIRYSGTVTALETTLRFYRSTDATIERSDTQFATRRRWMGTTWYRDRWHEYLWVKAPSSTGTYYYGACVDEVAGEPDTTNNCSAAVAVEFSHDKPELWVGSWAMWGIFPVGELVYAVGSVWNIGGASEATTLRLILLPSRESAPSAGTQVGEVEVPELVVTKAAPARLKWIHVKFRAPAAAGTYYYVMCVDAVPDESDTTNNCSFSHVRFG